MEERNTGAGIGAGADRGGGDGRAAGAPPVHFICAETDGPVPLTASTATTTAAANSVFIRNKRRAVGGRPCPAFSLIHCVKPTPPGRSQDLVTKSDVAWLCASAAVARSRCAVLDRWLVHFGPSADAMRICQYIYASRKRRSS